jgi:hypothetical protein
MLSLDTMDAMQTALDLPLEERLHNLLSNRVADTIACDLQNLTHIVVVESGDTEADFIETIGFSPLVDRIDGSKFDAASPPDWDWHHSYTGWWELVYCVGNTGFAYVIFVPNTDATDAELLHLCRTYACTIKHAGAVG